MGMVCNSPCFRCCFVLKSATHYTTFGAENQVFIGRNEGFSGEKAQKAQKRFVTVRGIFDRITGWKTDDRETRRKVKDL